MIYSMTGFGRAEAQINDKQVTVEIKSLNGKQSDINCRMPPVVRAYELDIRSFILQSLVRGTIDASITIKQDGVSKPMKVNTALVESYYRSIRQVAENLDIPQDNILSSILRLPEVVAPDQEAMSQNEWLELRKVVAEAMQQLMEHRANEGKMLEDDICSRIQNIENLLTQVEPFEKTRVEKLRAKFMQALADLAQKDAVDQNRFEQELIFYIEKIDVSEEKSRLRQHCLYFYEIMQMDEISKGKKLGFLLQEVGREINTLGSKANDADIQKIVVQMKDELEKAKEQSLNVL